MLVFGGVTYREKYLKDFAGYEDQGDELLFNN